MNLFNKNNYKKLMFIPFIFLIIFIILIFVFPKIEQGIDLKGGNQIIVHYQDQKEFSNIKPTLENKYNLTEVSVNETKSIDQYGILIEFSLQKDIENARAQYDNLDFENSTLDNLKQETENILLPLINSDFLTQQDLNEIDKLNTNQELKDFLKQKLQKADNNFNNSVVSLIKSELDLKEDAKIQTREVAATLGENFTESSTKVGIVAFVLLIIVILLFFREWMPSALIIFAAVFDIFAALAGMALFGLPLSLTTIPALLMLIGYSVDTDILLSSRFLKERKNVYESANSTIKTGLTMTLTTMATILVMLIISYFSQIIVIFEISIILLCGLVGDLISTWFFNAPALIGYVKNKRK